MYVESASSSWNNRDALMVHYTKARVTMENNSHNKDDVDFSTYVEDMQCQALDLSTKCASAVPHSASSSFSSAASSPPPLKKRHLAKDSDSKVGWESLNLYASSTVPSAVIKKDVSVGGADAVHPYVVESISPCSSNNDELRETNNLGMVLRFSDSGPRECSPLLTLPPLHGISPISQTLPAQYLEAPSPLRTLPFNAAAAAAAAAAAGVHSFLQGFQNTIPTTLADAASLAPGLPLYQRDFATVAAAFPSYLPPLRRRRKIPRGSVADAANGSPNLPLPVTDPQGARGTDDDCSGESTSTGRTVSRSSERSLSEEKDSAYLERRRKNNEAAKRSRDARRQKEEEIAFRAAKLEQENISLKAELLLLRRESAELHSLLYGRVDPQR